MCVRNVHSRKMSKKVEALKVDLDVEKMSGNGFEKEKEAEGDKSKQVIKNSRLKSTTTKDKKLFITGLESESELLFLYVDIQFSVDCNIFLY